MDTPPSAIKRTSLTPCRRLGLSRPSSGSLTPHLVRSLENKLGEGPENTSTPLRENRLSVPLKNINTVSSGTTVQTRQCFTVRPNSSLKPPLLNPNTPKVHKSFSRKRKLSEEFSDKVKDKSKNIQTECSNDSGTIIESPSDSLFSNIKVTPEMIEKIALSIIEKKKKLEQIKVQEVYAKKHDLVELRQQTMKWKTAGQEALRYSLSLAKQSGYSITLKQLMSQHGFLPHLMDYNSEDDEFD